MLIDVAVAMLALALLVSFMVTAIRNRYDVIRDAAGLPAMHSYVETDTHAFRTTDAGTEPSTAPTAAGRTDAGENIQAVRTAQFDATLGLRGYSVAAFVPGTQRFTVGGAARLEPLALPLWKPDASGLPVGTSSFQLKLVTGSPSKGILRGSGRYLFGTSVPIQAVPFLGRTFSQWVGTANIANRTAAFTTVTIDEDRTLTAVFAP